jgi:hypothetical protein
VGTAAGPIVGWINPRHFGSSGSGRVAGFGFFTLGGSAWIMAHWGWIPPREYTAFLQTGQVGLVGIGTCQCFSATIGAPPKSQGSGGGAWCRQ